MSIDQYAPITGRMLGETATVNVADKIAAIASGTSPASTFAHAAVTVGTTAVLLAAGSGTLAGRRLLTVHNNSNTIVYVGASGVTTSSGIPLLPGDRISIATAEDVYAIAASGTNDVRIGEYK